jgi:hypothetical protein
MERSSKKIQNKITVSIQNLQMNLSVYTPVIVKYRDEKTDLSTTLEELLR